MQRALHWKLAGGLDERALERQAPVYAANLRRLFRKRVMDVAADAAGRVSFRGFRGRYRLTWTGADGKPVTKLVEVK